MEVGMKIKCYLKENGISQTFISDKTFISKSKLNLALNGHRKMTFEEYEYICGALGVNTDFFIKPKLPEKQQEGA